MKKFLALAVFTFGLHLAANTSYSQERPTLPNFDRRAERLAPLAPPPADPAGTPREQAERTLKSRVRDVRIDADPVTRSPKWIGSTERFLTGPNGNGGGVSARAAALPANEKHRAVKMFLNEHRGLFGHDATALAGAQIQREDTSPASGLKTVVWQQMLDGIPVFEGTLKAAMSAGGELVNVGSQFVAAPAAAADAGTPNRALAQTAPRIGAAKAVALAAANVGTEIAEQNVQAVGQPDGAALRQHFSAQGLIEPRVTLVWLPVDAAAMRLCWSVILTSKARGEMFRVLVDADSGEVQIRHCLTEYISNASYRVFTSDSPTPLSPGHATPLTTQPALAARTLVTTPAFNTTASPDGWINDGVNETRGNNVDAHLDLDDNDIADLPRPQGAAGRVFDFPLDLTLQAPSAYRDAAVTDLFYWCNVIHDRFYELGFTEAAGNFQNNTFGRGGLGNDAVQADAQDGSGTNNANFSTPPDGSPGRMQMYVFTGPTPDRDGDFDHEIVIHEYTHGLSNRLVGGGTGISALQTRGMGEGWSDFYALCLLAEAGDDIDGNYASGAYASHLLSPTYNQNYYFGIRRYPYSTNLTKNPLTFKDIDPTRASPHTGIPINPIFGASDPAEVHNQGEVWCSALWEVRASLVRKLGFPTGNTLALQLVTDGMKLSPANPNFLQARDAVVQAELVLTGGANRGELWAAFAKRGMGANATSPASNTTTGIVENFELPDTMSVSPTTGFSSRGDAGGPFSATSTAFTLRNNGTALLNWTASKDAAWLTLSSAGGSLAASATTPLTASLNAAANALANGSYTGTVTITNTTSGIAQTRVFTLRVGIIDYFTEVFDTTANDTAFQSFTFTPNGSVSFYRPSRTTATTFPTNPTGGTALPLGDDTFNTITLTGGATVRLYGTSYGTIHVGSNGYVTFVNGDSSLSGSLGSHFALKRIAALMTDLLPNTTAVTWRQLADRVAVTWQNVPEFSTPNSNSFQIEMFFDGRIRITILGIGATGGLIGLSNAGGIPVDFTESDFSAYGPDSFLTLTAPAQATEGAGVLVNAGRVTANAAPAANLTVTLSSNRPADVAVPATVTILAGQTFAQFPLTIGNNALLDGSRTAVLTASASLFVSAQSSVIVNDNEVGVLTVSAPSSATEGGPNPQGTVTVSPAVSADVFVMLTSGNPAEIQVPAGVTILAGQNSASFPITIVDDQALDGTVATTITASVTNWTPGSATISVLDNETTNLTLSAPATLREGDTGITGTLTIGGSLTTALVVPLYSDDTSEIILPATVTIPAGQTTVTFPITVVNDPLADGTQTVMLTAFVNGFSWTLAIVSVADNDAHHFSVSPIASPVVRSAPVAVSVSARDVNDAIITNFNQTVSFTTNPASVPVTPTSTSGFVNGVLAVNLTFTANGSGVVLTVADTGGHTGVSNVFDVMSGPAVRFVWNTVASPKFVDAPFAVTIRAVDAGGNSVLEYEGTATLSSPLSTTVQILSWTAFADTAIDGEYGRTKQAISRFFPNYNETTTTTTDATTLASLLTGKNVFLIVEQETGTAATLGAIGTAWSAVLSNFVNSGGTVIVCSHGASEHLLLTNSGLLNVTPITSVDSGTVTKPADTPLNAGVVTPFTGEYLHTYSTTSGVASLQSEGNPLVISREVGAGRVVLIGTDFFTIGTEMDRVIANAVGLAQPFTGGGALPVNPASTGVFVAGEWTGNVSLPFTGNAVALRATDDALSGDSNAFAVTTAVPPSTLGTVLMEDFESGILNPDYWTITGTGGFHTINSDLNGPHGGLRHMTMDEATDSGINARNEATLTVNLAGRTAVQLKFWAIGYNEDSNGPPSSPFPSTGADFDGVAISADGGANWYEVQPLRPLTGTYAQYTVDLDAAISARGLAYSSNFKIRFNQYDNFAIPTDGIGIDDILITAAAPPSALTLNIPAQATEGAGVINGSVSVPTAPAANLVLTLSSKSPGKVTVPATVTILAGQTSATFPLTVLDDLFVDGTKNVVITAVGAGFLETGATIRIIDNDGGALSLSLPATVGENAGTLSGTLSLSLPSLVPFTVALASNNPLAAQPPATVSFAPGATTASFTVTIPDDLLIDGNQNVRITATAVGWTSGIADFVVQDNESRTLTVNIPASFREGDAPKVGTVSIGGIFTTNLLVSLSSNDTTEITVPASVTILAGQSLATFAITVQNDTIVDGAQPFTITASAATFASGAASGQVRDNEAHHFTFAPIGSPQIANGPVPAIITARDADEAVLTEYNSPVTLSATGSFGALTVAPAAAGAFVNGVSVSNVQINALATNVVLTATAASGATGSSNAFDLATGAISRFAWDPVASPQTLDTPFNVTVRAVGLGGATVPNYNGVANLSVGVPSENPTIGTGATTTFRAIYTASHDSRSDSIYTASEVGGAARINALALNFTTVAATGEPLTNLTIRLKHTALTTFTAGTSWDNTGWTQVYRASPTVSATGWTTFTFTTPFDYNGTGNLLVDISIDRTATTSALTSVQGTATAPVRSVYGFSASTNGDPLTWSGLTPFPNTVTERADVRFSVVKELPIRPALSGAFANGVWTGQVSVPITGNPLILSAQAGTVSGTTNPFNVNAATTPSNGTATVLAENFESGTLNPAYWTVSGTGNFHTINSDLNGPHGGVRHMTMDASPATGAFARNEGTLTVDLAGRSGVSLSFWAKGFNEAPHGPPPSPFPAAGADFDGVAISTDGGANWYEVQPLRSLTSTYAQFIVNLDAALVARGLAYGSDFKIRFNQYDDSTIPSRGIAIDDILIAANAVSGFTFTAPAQVTEGADEVNASVALAAVSATDTVIALTSSAPAKLAVPASVTVPAGELSAAFAFIVPDDSIADGNRTAIITGTIAGQPPRSILVAVLDNDPLPFTLSAPATLSETAVGQIGTITLGAAASSPVTISLTSSNTSAVQVPVNVTFVVGQQTATFPITVVNDMEIDGTQIATITASVPGWTDATATVLVTDNETRALSITAPVSILEGATGTGSVTLSGTLPLDFAVTLTSSNPAQLTVPASATIPAGQTSATFIATAVDDTAADGSQNVTITASVPTFTSATGTTTALDNDVHHFTFGTVATTQLVGVPFTTTVSARDLGNVQIPTFTGTAALSAAGNAGAVTLTPTTTGAFTAGLWTGAITMTQPGTNVRLTATGAGVSGVSTSFNVSAGSMISLTPASITLSLARGTNATRTLTIGNTGDLPLTWSIGTAAALAGEVIHGPEFAGTGSIQEDKEHALPPTLADAYTAPREAAEVPTADAIPALTSTLTNLNANQNLVRALIPNRYAFTDGVTGNNISDGGGDMYDGGNFLGTNITPGTFLNYSDNVIAASTLLGTGGQYFTRKYDGLFVFAANVNALTYFEITGNLGADSGGLTDSAVLTATSSGTTYRGFVKRVYNAGDPSVNHLIIVPDNGTATHTTATDTNDDFHRVSNLNGVTRIYHLLFGGTGGAYIDNTAMQSIMTTFLDAVAAPDWVTPAPLTGTVAAGGSQNVTLTIATANLTAGSYTRTLIVTSNDVLHPQVSSTINLTVTDAPSLQVTPAGSVSTTGLRAGPFAPLTHAFTLSNPGSGPVAWTASETTPWLSLSAASGTLASGANTTVTATLDSAALNALTSGAYSATLTFVNTTNGTGNTTRVVNLTVSPAGDLSVSPASGFAPDGRVGGPFVPATQAWTLSNTGDAALSWSATRTQAWLTLSPASGTLLPGASTTLTASLSGTAPSLAVGIYSDTASITNTSTGRGTTSRPASLTIRPPAPVLAPEPATTGGTSNAVAWSAVPGASAYAVQASNTSDFAVAVDSGWIAATSYTFTPLADGSNFFYRVRSRQNAGTLIESAWSNVVSSTQDATAPALTVTSPIATSTVLHTLTGTASDAAGLSEIVVNGVAAASGDAFAHWSLPVTLTAGANTFSVVARDNANPANVRTVSHTVTVTPAAGDGDGDGLPDAWEALYGLSTTDANGANGALGDPDGDGRITLLELALGSNPVLPDIGAGTLPALVPDANDGKTYLTLQFRRLIAPGALSYLVETSTDLSQWHSGPASVEQVGVPVANSDGITETVTVRALPAVGPGAITGNIRLRIALP